MSIITELKSNFNDEIVGEASKIYNTMNTMISRGDKRSIKYLFCVYNAYINLNKVVDIRILAKKMMIDQKKISEAFIVCSPIRTGYNFKKVRFRVSEYVLYYLDELSIEYTLKIKILNIVNVVFSNDISKSYKKSYSNQTISIGFILICFDLFSSNLGNKFKQIIYRKTSTIENMIKTVKKYTNKVKNIIYSCVEELNTSYEKIIESSFFGVCMIKGNYEPSEVAGSFLAATNYYSGIFQITFLVDIMKRILNL